jgi:RNA polymerase sigma-70 factor (ECF subfamily)
MATVDKHQLEPLLRRALAGDAGAWNDFFRAIRKYLHAEVRKVVGPDAPADFEHSVVVQSTLRRVWERIEDQFPDGPETVALRRFLAWVSVIARNRSWEECRRLRRRPQQGADAALDSVPEPRPRQQTVQRDQLAAEVAAALARLPDKQRQVIELFWFERLSDGDIAGRLGCSPGAVRVMRFRALRSLQSPKLQALLENSHVG